MVELPARFWAKVEVGDCWEWMGARSRSGYGVAFVDGVSRRPHRAVYSALVGLIPDGLDLDHLCRNRACVNPDHLEPVTRAENIRRGFRIAKTSCPAGHTYDEANTKLYQGRRYCRACHLIHSRTYRARRRVA